MKYKTLILEKKEYVYLKRILNISGYANDDVVRKSLLKLTEELKTANILDEEKMPKDVVRFNSVVTLKSNKGWERVLEVVIPQDKDLSLNKISILTPMGAALFGYSKGDIVDWDFPGGKQKLKIVDVTISESLKGLDVVI
ncbi:regulator of nucleoside diphosphate kinase [Lacinutrix venerupis]|uniref:Transcription elongation factor GreAB n=1 Tax=Lacinutrix venerupis TaxID=1486034 RepID=A0AAC9LNJ3_9FLAO|nr:GreA/GreB family elongation factor [Lacinutrix venerupis]APX99956.1 transcription elongation factor GreAB [Lacinutrix venerupis]RLJ62626.1 regulator of nucleoside diphosphate kinase [Lacinutrix venerupis]